MDRWLVVLTFAAAIGSGLIGGVFFAFSTFVMRALWRRPPAEGIAAMQAINVAVINPAFLGVFLATALISVIVAVGTLVRWERAGTVWLLAGSALYVLGTFVVTVAFNVPLNDARVGRAGRRRGAAQVGRIRPPLDRLEPRAHRRRAGGRGRSRSRCGSRYGCSEELLMGLEGVELVMAAESEFGIRITDEAAQRVRTVGEFHDLVRSLVEMEGRPELRARTDLDQHLWSRVQILASTHGYGVPPAKVTRETRFVEDLGYG
jgi:uncharacterized membrane protein